MRLPDRAYGKKLRCVGCRARLAVSKDGAVKVFATLAAPDKEDEIFTAELDEEQASPARRRGKPRPNDQPSEMPVVAAVLIGGAIGLVTMIFVVGVFLWRQAQTEADSSRADQTPVLTPGTFPPLPVVKNLEPGIMVYEAAFRYSTGLRQIWIYLPEKPLSNPIPIVLIAPAGSPLIHGMELGNGDRAEHLPYVRAGFVVVAYSIDGHLAERDQRNDRAVVTAVRAFKQAEAGVANARYALDYALMRISHLDQQHIATAGHSSAATLSLQVAEHDARVKACLAYAPVADVMRRTPAQAVNLLDQAVPGFRQFLVDYSPHSHLDRLQCPVFLFHAEDDSNVPIQQTVEVAAQLKLMNPQVTFVRVPTGDHYDSMIREGIPQGIGWLKRVWDVRAGATSVKRAAE
jgi:pimeloyl-ACP methyl ester carboxylesterase